MITTTSESLVSQFYSYSSQLPALAFAEQALVTQDLEKALTLAQQCLQDNSISRADQIAAHILISEAQVGLDEYGESLASLIIAESLFSEEVNNDDKLLLLTSLSHRQYYMGLYEEAAKTWLKVSIYSAEYGDINHFVQGLLGIGSLFEIVGFHDTARYYFQKAMRLLHKVDSPIIEVNTYFYNVGCLLSLDKLKEAEAILKRCQGHEGVLRIPHYAAQYHLYQGRLLRKKGQYKVALQSAQVAKSHAQLCRGNWLKSCVQLELALCFVSCNECENGLKLLKITLFNIRNTGLLLLQRKLNDALSDAYYALGDFSKALDYEKNAHRLQLDSIAKIPVGDLDSLCKRKLTEMERLLDLNCAKEENKRLKKTVRGHSFVVEKLQHDVFTDPLTGIYNRRWLDEQLSEKNSLYSLLLIDADYFKSINDDYSHHIGDQVLKRLAAILDLQLRKCDSVSRYGGEEFVVLLSDISESQVHDLAERLRLSIADEDWSSLTPGRQLTISIGGAIRRYKETSESVLIRADAALYLAKENGRNRYCFTQSKGKDIF